MRGRIIQGLVAVWRRLDPVATTAVPGGGYDSEFNEPRPVADGTQLGAPSRRERAAERVVCQVARVTQTGVDDRLLTRTGQQETAGLEITLHRTALEAAGLFTSDGCQLAPGDRLEALETTAGAVSVAFPTSPGMWVTGVVHGGFGLAAFGTPQVNLIIVRCAPAPLARAEGA